MRPSMKSPRDHVSLLPNFSDAFCDWSHQFGSRPSPQKSPQSLPP